MYSLSPRQKNILLILSNQPEILTGKSLCGQLNISLRTLQAEVKAINEIMDRKIILSTNRGYQFDRDSLSAMDEQDFQQENNDQEALLKKLILENPSYQIDELADSLYMSLSTLNRRLNLVQKRLERSNLHLEKKNGQVSITGSEMDKRKLIRDLIYEETNPIFLNIESCSSFFEGLNVISIRDIILKTIERYNCYVEECYSTNLIINILIALSRMQKAYSLDAFSAKLPENSKEYRIAKDICRQFASHCSIDFQETDIQYIGVLIMGQIKPDQLVKHIGQFDETISRDFEEEINRILQKTFRYYMLNINYDHFLYNFVLHVDALIRRAKNHQYVSSYITENVKSNCPFIYDVAVYIAKEIEERFQIRVIDEEIGFISIHIGFAIENSTASTDKVRVLLLCNQYHRIAAALLEKLKENYSDVIEITNVITSPSQRSLEGDADLILSTVPLLGIGKRAVTISPFYTTQDRYKIDEAIQECSRAIAQKKGQNLLPSYFRKELFFRDLEFSDKEEVIRFLGKKTEAFGLTRPGFTESVLKREAMSSTCFFDTFAIPHALELEAKKTMFCVLINENGIPWDNHVIKCVFMIAINKADRKSFMKIYNGIIQILCDKEKVNHLVKCKNPMEFIEWFQ